MLLKIFIFLIFRAFVSDVRTIYKVILFTNNDETFLLINYFRACVGDVGVPSGSASLHDDNW